MSRPSRVTTEPTGGDGEYAALLTRLFAARRAGIVFGLDRVAAVLARLGHPERRLGTVAHVGGTNGKGSTAVMVAAMARAAGRRTALYTSPHLASLRERFVVDGELASEAAVVAAAARVAAAGGDTLTFFEQVTAIAFVLFADASVEVAVIEVGLGGRLDATSVIEAPVAAVTGVAMDHQDMLGDSLAAIAGEKAGIWRRGQRVVIGCAGEPEAVPWLRDAAVAAGAASVRVVSEEDVARVVAADVGLLGEHQRVNAACAVAVMEAMADVDATMRMTEEARAAALREVAHPGRLEIVSERPAVLLDGAHNPHGAAALARFLAERAERPRVLVLAVSGDKDVRRIVTPLVGVVEMVVASRYDQPRALAVSELAALVREVGGGGVICEEAATLSAAVDRARVVAGEEGLVVVGGSLMAVGEVRPWFRVMARDPMVVSDPGPRS